MAKSVIRVEIFSDLSFDASSVSSPIKDIPVPVIPPEGTHAGGNVFAVCEVDEFFGDRSTNINQTNMINPNRPISQGIIGLIRSLFGLQVSPNGKHIVNIGGTSWWKWIIERLGLRNAVLFASPGDGNCDTNEPNIDILDPNTDIKLLSATYGGGLVKIIGEIFQNGWYDVIETLDFSAFPVKDPDTGDWLYKGERISFMTHPHLFTVRVNRVVTSILTWLTRNGINAATDAGVEGGKGDEEWPKISKVPVCQPRRMLRRYPAIGTRLKIYKESLIVDGNLVDRPEGITITVNDYIFHGSDTYVQDMGTRYWYKADELLVRASVEFRGPGTGFDYRCYAALESNPKTPWMGFMGFRAPRCGWKRKNL